MILTDCFRFLFFIQVRTLTFQVYLPNQHLKQPMTYKKFILIKYFYHPPMSQSIFFPKFDKVKHFDTFRMESSLQNPLHPNIENLKGIGFDKTEASMEEKQKYKTRSSKIVADPLNISFEQSYMEQHKACFQKELQKYMEHQQSILGSLKPEGLKRKTFELHQSHNLGTNLHKTIKEYGLFLSEVQMDMLIIDLKREDKLSEFLEFVFNKVNEESIKDIIYLVNLIWEEYFPVQEMGFSQQETMEFAENFIAKHLDHLEEKLSQINYKAAQTMMQGKKNSAEAKQRLGLFKKFATFFTTTVLMVISGYFENPYTNTEENYYKRDLNELGLGFQNEDEFNDDDLQSEEEEVIINKKIKY